jgi:purine-binding chemotaxis protein CheW
MVNAAQEIQTEQYLTFILDGEQFGVDVRETREILDLPALTRIPQSPEYMLGVINLRGAIVPVVDLRRKFATTGGEQVANSCVIVLEVAAAEGLLIIGVLADEVCEVIDLDAAQIQAAPRLGSRIRTEYIKGLGHYQERFVILLETARIFREDELERIQTTAA